MDARSVELLDQLIVDHLDRLTKQLPAAGGAPGGEAVRLVGRLIDRFRSERESILTDLSSATTSEEREVLARRLERLFLDLKIFQPHLTPFVRDASTESDRLGLQVVIEGLVKTLLSKGADPVLHLEQRHLYATMDLARSLKNLWDQLPSAGADDTLWEWDSGPPVVFFVPDLDPDNAMYLPILAHEVGHQAVWQSDLGDKVMSRCAQDLQPLFDAALGSGEGLQAYLLRRQLRQWVDEIICDALATVLCGPGFLFAAAAFLPVSATGTPDSTHPFPRERVKLTLELLRHGGWANVLMNQTPNVIGWLDQASIRTPAETARERFLLEALDVAAPHVRAVALEHLDGACLQPDVFVTLQDELRRLLDKGVPPAQVAGQPVQHWHIVAAAWFHRISAGGDSPRAVAQGAVDSLTNGRVLKAIELARIVELWEEEGNSDAGS